jgi:hypothetical protein
MKKFLLAFSIFAFLFFNGLSQVTSISQAQSMFIYNFSRLIQWPAGSSTGEFVIGVVGDNELYTSLLSFVANKKVGAQSIVVKKFEDPQSISRCQIIFVGNSKISKFPDVISRIQGFNSLLITEKRGMINSGSAIDFVLVEDKLKFVMNPENAVKYNLTVSKSLEDMAYKN